MGGMSYWGGIGLGYQGISGWLGWVIYPGAGTADLGGGGALTAGNTVVAYGALWGLYGSFTVGYVEGAMEVSGGTGWGVTHSGVCSWGSGGYVVQGAMRDLGHLKVWSQHGACKRGAAWLEAHSWGTGGSHHGACSRGTGGSVGLTVGRVARV